MTSKKVWRLYSPVLKALVLLLGAMGQYYSLRGSSFASGAHFLYYTNVSNILASLLAAVLLALDIRALRAGRALLLPRWLWEVRFALVAGILLTFVVFSLLLIPRMPFSYLSSPSNCWPVLTSFSSAMAGKTGCPSCLVWRFPSPISHL
jgi:hypothetical protein